MNVLRRWLRPRQAASAEVAKQRLKLVLVHDRLDMTPQLMETLKGDLIAVMSRHFDVDQTGISVEVVRSDRHDQLSISIPIKRRRT